MYSVSNLGENTTNATGAYSTAMEEISSLGNFGFGVCGF